MAHGKDEIKVTTTKLHNKRDKVIEVTLDQPKDLDFEEHKDIWFQFSHMGVTYDCKITDRKEEGSDKDKKNALAKLILVDKLNDDLEDRKQLILTELDENRPRV